MNEIEAPTKRSRGRPPNIRPLRVQPIARRTIDFRRLARLLIALTQRDAGHGGENKPGAKDNP